MGFSQINQACFSNMDYWIGTAGEEGMLCEGSEVRVRPNVTRTQLGNYLDIDEMSIASCVPLFHRAHIFLENSAKTASRRTTRSTAPVSGGQLEGCIQTLKLRICNLSGARTSHMVAMPPRNQELEVPHSRPAPAEFPAPSLPQQRAWRAASCSGRMGRSPRRPSFHISSCSPHQQG